MHQREPVATFAPKASGLAICLWLASTNLIYIPQAWAAMCELLGGEDRIDPEKTAWNDSFIVNLGTVALGDANGTPPKQVDDPAALDNWHVDGDHFVSRLWPTQAVLRLISDAGSFLGFPGARFAIL